MATHTCWGRALGGLPSLNRAAFIAVRTACKLVSHDVAFGRKSLKINNYNIIQSM